MKRATPVKLKQLLVKAATRHQENFAQMSGNISTNDPAGKEFSANYATKSTRTLSVATSNLCDH